MHSSILYSPSLSFIHHLDHTLYLVTLILKQSTLVCSHLLPRLILNFHPLPVSVHTGHHHHLAAVCWWDVPFVTIAVERKGGVLLPHVVQTVWLGTLCIIEWASWRRPVNSLSFDSALRSTEWRLFPCNLEGDARGWRWFPCSLDGEITGVKWFLRCNICSCKLYEFISAKWRPMSMFLLLNV